MAKNILINSESAIKLFEESSILHTNSTQMADYKTGNNAYKSICKSVDFLKLNNEIDALLPFLNHLNNGVRVWAATFLLKNQEVLSIKTLEEVSKGTDIISFNAEMTLSEWRKGNLKT